MFQLKFMPASQMRVKLRPAAETKENQSSVRAVTYVQESAIISMTGATIGYDLVDSVSGCTLFTAEVGLFR